MKKLILSLAAVACLAGSASATCVFESNWTSDCEKNLGQIKDAADNCNAAHKQICADRACAKAKANPGLIAGAVAGTSTSQLLKMGGCGPDYVAPAAPKPKYNEG